MSLATAASAGSVYHRGERKTRRTDRSSQVCRSRRLDRDAGGSEGGDSSADGLRASKDQHSDDGEKGKTACGDFALDGSNDCSGTRVGAATLDTGLNLRSARGDGG